MYRTLGVGFGLQQLGEHFGFEVWGVEFILIITCMGVGWGRDFVT